MPYKFNPLTGQLDLVNASSGGSVTSVNVSGGTTGLTASGGPITGSGVITIAGTLGTGNGGTGVTNGFAGDTLHVLKVGDTMSGQLNVQNNIVIGLSTSSPVNSLALYQGSNGTAGQQVSLRGDFNNLYLSNSNGKVVVEKALDESHALFIQEASSPFQGVGWWFDGSSSTGTGVWMASAPAAGDINMKVNGTAGTYGLRVKNSSGTTVATIDSLGRMFPIAAATASAPAYVKGGMYFDTTLNKMRIGGATAWETVTST